MTMLPFDDSTLDYIILGGTRSPGTVTLAGHDRLQEWDIKKATGQTGASSALLGSPVGGFTAAFFLLDEAQIEEWKSFQAIIESTTSGPTPTALPVYHPDLATNGYSEVSNGGIGGLIRSPDGSATVQVQFIEFRPPKPKPPKKAYPKPAEARPGAPPKPDPNAQLKAQLAALEAQAASEAI